MQATPEEIKFRISELIDWIREFISRGDAFSAGVWATTIAHIGNVLLRRQEYYGEAR